MTGFKALLVFLFVTIWSQTGASDQSKQRELENAVQQHSEALQNAMVESDEIRRLKALDEPAMEAELTPGLRVRDLKGSKGSKGKGGKGSKKSKGPKGGKGKGVKKSKGPKKTKGPKGKGKGKGKVRLGGAAGVRPCVSRRLHKDTPY